MSRARRAADRIREEVPLSSVLMDYGYNVHPDGGNREQQFSCDLHGDGSDSKPSARLYPDGNQFFCFACGVSRDAIALVREKEGVAFWDAVKKLEQKYGLTPLPWEEGDQYESPEKALKAGVSDNLRPTETPEQSMHRLDRFLQGLTTERALNPQKLAGFWEAHDRVAVHLAEKGDPDSAVGMAHRILSAAKEALKGES